MSRRTEKIAQAVRQVVSTAILFGLRDPRVQNVTVLHAEVAGDLRTAKVYVSIMGEDKVARLSLQGLEAARGFIQGKIAEELDLRYTPVLTFVIDNGIKKSIEISRILRESGIVPQTTDAAESAGLADDDDAELEVAESPVVDPEVFSQTLEKAIEAAARTQFGSDHAIFVSHDRQLGKMTVRLDGTELPDATIQELLSKTSPQIARQDMAEPIRESTMPGSPL